MGLRATIASAVGTAFNAIGDVAVSVTYRSKGSQAYNPATGAVSSTDVDYTIQCIIESAADEGVENVIRSGDAPTLCMTFDLSSLAVTPDTGDVVVYGGDTYSVDVIEIDPAGATCKLTVSEVS